MNNNDVIVTLKGPERIRRRPDVVFGDDGQEGATEAVRMLLDIFITEISLGFCEKISLVQEEDQTVVIESQDRGFLLDETLCDGKPAWYYDFCDFGCPPLYTNDEYYYSVGRNYGAFYGATEEEMPRFKAKYDPAFGLCCVQYASRWMQVEAVRANLRKTLCFEKGYPVGDMKRENAAEASYTKFSFQLDQEVFSDISVSMESLAEYLRSAVASFPDFVCTVFAEDRRAVVSRVGQENV